VKQIATISFEVGSSQLTDIRIFVDLPTDPELNRASAFADFDAQRSRGYGSGRFAVHGRPAPLLADRVAH
jgi:hypothetical protein